MDAGEPEHAKKEFGKKGQTLEQRRGKGSKKGGEAQAERQKGAPKNKDSQASWVKKEADGSEEEHRPLERRGRQAKERGGGKGENWKDERGGGKGETWKEERGGGKGENWKENRGDGKKDSWKERRGKQQERYEGGDGVNEAGARQRGNAGNGDANADALNGGALLNLLKANPPSVRRYTREELISIGQLPAAKVKPSSLNPVIDKENGASPLLLKIKVDRGRRREGGEEDEEDEDGAARRDRRTQREQRREEVVDEEEPGDRRVNRRWDKQQWEEQDYYQQQQQQQKGGFREAGKGNHHHEDHSRDGSWMQPDKQWAMPTAPKGDSQWDMPHESSNAPGLLSDFTLGDIRQAERSFNKGMSMSDYKASLKAGELVQTEVAQPLEPVAEARSSAERSKDTSGGFFVDEDEDVAQASRGFGKWFNRGADAGKGRAEAADDDEDDGMWDMPTQGSSDGPLSLGMLQPDMSKPSPSAPSQQHQPRSPEAYPSAFSSIERLLEESPVGNNSAHEAFHLDGAQGGKSILSMIGRTEGGDADSSDPSKQGKLSVAELFHLAQGKELPSMPTVTRKEDGEETAEQKMQREALQMASHLMWMAAAKAGQPGMPPMAAATSGSRRYPGYQPQAMYGGVAPAAYGMTRPGVQHPGLMGRGTPHDHLYAEAYAQAMMGAGRGGFPAGGRGATKGAQASWPAQGMGAYGAGYGSQPYGGYPSQDYSHPSRAAGGFDASSAQSKGYNPKAAAMHGMYSGLGVPEGTRAAAKASAPLAGKGGGLGGALYNQASSLGGGLATASSPGITVSAGADAASKLPDNKPGQEEAEDDAGCSQS